MKKWLFFAVSGILAVLSAAPLCQAGTIAGEAKAKGIRHSADIVVYLEGGLRDKSFVPPATPVTVDQREMTYLPHVLPILVGSTVAFPNSDEVRHNIFSKSNVKKFNLGTYEAGQSRSVVFDKPGIVEVLCNVHEEMQAWILVLENPYYTVTNRRGKFTISDVPEGKYRLTAWHEKLKPQTKEVVVPAEGTVEIDFQLSR